MKNFILLFLICLVIYRCTDNSDVTISQATKGIIPFEYRKEGMPVDSIRINGKYGFFLNKNEVNELFGSLTLTDSLKTYPYFRYKFKDRGDKCYVFVTGGTILHQCGDVFFPVYIDLESTPIEITLGQKIRLYQNMPSVNLLSFFPLSTSLWRGRMGNAMTGYVMVNEDIYNEGYYQWVFHIHHDRLSRVQLLSFQDCFDLKNKTNH